MKEKVRKKGVQSNICSFSEINTKRKARGKRKG